MNIYIYIYVSCQENTLGILAIVAAVTAPMPQPKLAHVSGSAKFARKLFFFFFFEFRHDTYM